MTESKELNPETISDLLAAFKNFDDSYRRHEVDAAVAKQDNPLEGEHFHFANNHSSIP